MLTGIQHKLAMITGLSEGFISHVLSGNRRPSWKNSKKLAKVTFTDPILWLEGTPKQMRAALNELEISYTIKKKDNGQKETFTITDKG